MKKEKAIEILRRQQSKINSITVADSETWIFQTASYIKLFFGEDSPEMKAINQFRYYNTNDMFLGRANSSLNSYKPVAHTFIENCIETINDKGLKKKEWKHILITTHPALFWTIFSAIVIAAFGLGKGCNAANKSDNTSKQQTTGKNDSIHVGKK
jgi:hypothetical protein